MIIAMMTTLQVRIVISYDDSSSKLKPRSKQQAKILEYCNGFIENCTEVSIFYIIKYFVHFLHLNLTLYFDILIF